MHSLKNFLRAVLLPILVLCFVERCFGQGPSDLKLLAANVETLNRKDDGYRGIWYSIGPSGDEYAYKYSGGLGTYCEKHRPFAVYSPESNKTFFCYGGTTTDSNQQLIHMVSYYDHRTGLVPRPTILLDKHTDDAHDNPVISLDDKGHVWIFSTSHGLDRPSFIHRSKAPYSIDEFERIDATQTTNGKTVPWDNFSYMQVWARPKGGFLSFYTHYQDPVDRTLMFMKSEDGQSWSQWQRLAAIGAGHYQVTTAEGPHAASAFDYHPTGKGLDYRTNLYYIETKDDGKTWQNVEGQQLQLPLTQVQNPALVHDYAPEKKLVYVKDILFNKAGHPIILYITSKGYESGPKNDPRIWTIARWTGTQWKFSEITNAHNNYDMGSLYLEENRWVLIAPTEIGPQAYNPGGEMCLWASQDQGATWHLERQMTNDSIKNHTFARSPVNVHPDFYAFWADGNARQPSESRLYFCNHKGDVFQLPSQMEDDFMKPQLIPVKGLKVTTTSSVTAAPIAESQGL
jgi:hypothetical protein